MDAELHGQICLKLACLQEARANIIHVKDTSKEGVMITVMHTAMFVEGQYCTLNSCQDDASSPSHIDAVLLKYDRIALLECLKVLDRGLKAVIFDRSFVNWDRKGQEPRSNKVCLFNT